MSSSGNGHGTGKGKFIFLGIVMIVVGLGWMYVVSQRPRYYDTQTKVEAAVEDRHEIVRKGLNPQTSSTAALRGSVMPSAFETADAEAVHYNWVATAEGRTIQKPASVLWPQDGQWQFRIQGGMVQIRIEGTMVTNQALDDRGNYVPIGGEGVIWPQGLDGLERMKSDALYMAVLGRICHRTESDGQCQARYNAERASQREAKTTLNPEWFVVGRCITVDLSDNYAQLAYNGVPADRFGSFWGGNGGGVKVTFTNKPAQFVDCNTWSGGQTGN